MTDRDDGAEDFGMLAALHERSRRFSEAIDRLDAEVASRERRRSEEIEPYLDRHPEMLEDFEPDFTADGKVHGEVVGEQILPEPGAERFGARLRQAISRNRVLRDWGFLAGGSLTREQVAELERIADAVDRDAAALAIRADGFAAGMQLLGEQLDYERDAHKDLRRQIEQLVEELRYTAIICGPSVISGMLGPETGRKDMVDVEPFLERLAGIFGEAQSKP